MPDSLKNTLAAFLSDIEESNSMLKSGKITPDEWQADVARSLVEHHMAAYMAGQGSEKLTPRAKQELSGIIGDQIDYLNKFTDKIAETGWRDPYAARAAMYAGSIKESYWKGAAKGLPLPGWPAVGTECLTNCGCSWDFDVLDMENDDVDAYWKRGKSDSCNTCIERESAWSPYKIRGGVGEAA